MNEHAKIGSTAEAWEDRELGCDEDFARPSQVNEADLDDSLDLQMISIRLQKGLLESLKAIASINHMGYQPLIKQALQRFVDGELRMMAIEYAKQIQAQQELESHQAEDCKDEEKRCA